MLSRSTTVSVTLAAVAALQLGAPARASDLAGPRLDRPPPRQNVLAAPGDFQSAAGDRVFFSEGSADLGARARLALEAQAAWLKRNPAVTVTIEGHADDPGPANRNAQLSHQRAEAVRLRLIEMGVAPDRIAAVGYGRERLVADCAQSACASHNRRAVTVLGGAVASSPPLATPARNDGAERRAPRRLF